MNSVVERRQNPKWSVPNFPEGRLWDTRGMGASKWRQPRDCSRLCISSNLEPGIVLSFSLSSCRRDAIKMLQLTLASKVNPKCRISSMIQKHIRWNSFSGSDCGGWNQTKSLEYVQFLPRKSWELANCLYCLLWSNCDVLFIQLMPFLLIRLAATTRWRCLSLPKRWVWPLFAYVLEASFLLSLFNFLKAVLKTWLLATLEPEENISKSHWEE